MAGTRYASAMRSMFRLWGHTTVPRISKPDGWPVGNYQVEIFVADKSAGTKAFTVK